MKLATVRLKKNEDRRLRAGHLWIYSNEIDTHNTPLKQFSPGEEVLIEAYDKTPLGVGYINPHSLITARLFSRKKQDRLTTDFFISHFKTALQWREFFFKKPFYRLVFSESDALPGLIIDRFDTTLVAQLNTAGMDAHKNTIVEALLQVLPETQSILWRNDSAARTFEKLPSEIVAAFGTPPEIITLEENSVSFKAPLYSGQKTGWFFDHRANRLRLKEYVAGRRVLDVFSYLGAWGIQAVHYGAAEVCCIDSSAQAVTWIEKNAALNQCQDKMRILEDDAFVALKNLIAAQEHFDVIILDPPAFVKKQKDLKEGLIAYQRLNELALKLLTPNGILISCSCSMHVSYDDLLQVIRKAVLQQRALLHVVERGHQAQDHPIHLAIPETDYLKMIIARKMH